MVILAWIFLGAGCGWLTGRAFRNYRTAAVMDVSVGVAGALLGGLLMRYGGFPGRVEVVSTTLGVILGSAVLTAFSRYIGVRDRHV